MGIQNAAMFTSATDLWATPDDFYRALDERFAFQLDVCATAENAKCARHFTRDDDGLSKPWSGVCWMNPPYGREIGSWVRKAYESSLEGATVVCLVPARTDTRWWHDFVMKAEEVWLVRGRLKFGGGKEYAPFPNAVVVFRNHYGFPTFGVLDTAGRPVSIDHNHDQVWEAA